MLKAWLAHPLTRGLDIDDPRTTHLRRRIVLEKKFLRQVYEEWYRAIVALLPGGPGAVLELGAGGGFMRDFIPNLITSEIFHCPNVRVVLDGSRLPFADKCLRGVVMTNVLHHLPRPRLFLNEATRCVRSDGVVVMIEPWVTRWSRFVYARFHHEPFDPDMPLWELPTGGPLSGANDALPWILFSRDRRSFEQDFPHLRIELIKPIMPLRYLISGGVSMRSLAPGWSFRMWRSVEGALGRWNDKTAMFSQIVLRRVV